MAGDRGGLAEEKCTCNSTTFGCIIVIGVDHLGNWSYDYTLLAHEFGHNLGVEDHDNEYYEKLKESKLIMWQELKATEYIWSPEARKSIMEHDNSCLEFADTKKPTIGE